MERHRVTIVYPDGDPVPSVSGYTPVISGLIAAIVYTRVNMEAGVDLAISGESTGIAVWEQDNIGAASLVKLPMTATHGTDGVAALYAAGGKAVLSRIGIGRERLAVTVTSASPGHSAVFDVLVE